jgi:hypothetical protein
MARLVDAAFRVAEDIVERGACRELRILEPARESSIVPLGPLSIDDEAELLVE